MHDFDVERANPKMLAVREQPVEVAAVGLQILHGEQRPKDPLNVADMLANRDLRARLGFDVRRPRKMIRMGVSLERPVDGPTFQTRRFENPLHRTNVDLARGVLVVENGINDGGALRFGVRDEIADRVGRFVEKGADHGSGHGGIPRQPLVQHYIRCI